jgi:hypothetical protein
MEHTYTQHGPQHYDCSTQTHRTFRELEHYVLGGHRRHVFPPVDGGIPIIMSPLQMITSPGP